MIIEIIAMRYTIAIFKTASKNTGFFKITTKIKTVVDMKYNK